MSRSECQQLPDNQLQSLQIAAATRVKSLDEADHGL